MAETDPFFANSQPPGWTKDELTKFIETANRNAWATYVHLPEYAKRLNVVHLLFKTAGENLTNSPDWFTGFFLLKSHSHYLAATRLATSCQIPETYMVLRGCLESALYGFYLHKHPASRVVWLSRHNDEASKKQVRREFQIGTMLDEVKGIDTSLANVLEQLYDQTIDYGAHPNERALSAHLRRQDGDDFVQFNYHYLDDNPLALQLALKTCLRVGIDCLKLFRLVYQERFDLLGLTQQIAGVSQGL